MSNVCLHDSAWDSGAEQSFRYAFASYLLAKGDHAAISEVEVAAAYGDPLGAHREIAHQRDFECGTVIVNANRTGTSPVTVRFDSIHTKETGAPVSFVALAGTTGTVLRKDCWRPFSIRGRPAVGHQLTARPAVRRTPQLPIRAAKPLPD